MNLARPEAVTRLLAVLLLIHLAINACVLVPIFGLDKTGKGGVVLSYLYPGLLIQPRADSWSPMYKAYIQARQVPHEPLYKRVFFADHIKFLYPPSSLLAFDLLDRVYPTEDPPAVWFRVMNLISLLLLLTLGGVLLAICREVEIACCRLKSPSWSALARQGAVWSALSISFYPMIRGYSLGQVQTWLSVGLAYATLAYLRGNKQIAGGIVGVMTLFKPYYAILLLWGVWRRQWRLVVPGAVVAATGTLAAIWRFGLADTLDYPAVLAFIGRRGEAYFPNQSLFGLLHRLFGHSDFIAWHPNSYPAPNGTMAFASTAFSLALLAVAFAGGRHSDRVSETIDLAIAVLATTMASPIAWEYHYAFLLPIYAVLIPLVVHTGAFRRLGVPLVAVTYIAAASYLPVARLVASGPRVCTLVLSHLFFSGLTVLGMLVIVRTRRAGATRSGPPAMPGTSRA